MITRTETIIILCMVMLGVHLITHLILKNERND